MTPTEEGAYFRLLCHAWNEPDCSLSGDDATLAKLSRLGDAWQQDSGARIRACFEPDPIRPGRIFNARQRDIRRQQQGRIDAAAARCERMRQAKAAKQAASRQASCKDGCKSLAKPLSSPVSRLSSHKQNADTHTARHGAPAFRPPSLEEVKAEAEGAKLPQGEGERFFNYWETREWSDKNGKPLAKWQNALRTWTAKGKTTRTNAKPKAQAPVSLEGVPIHGASTP